jgi:hypothetical protein
MPKLPLLFLSILELPDQLRLAFRHLPWGLHFFFSAETIGILTEEKVVGLYSESTALLALEITLDVLLFFVCQQIFCAIELIKLLDLKIFLTDDFFQKINLGGGIDGLTFLEVALVRW